MSERDLKCKDRVKAHYESRMEALRAMWGAEDLDEGDEDYGSIYEFGLSFDYVAMGTFSDQDRPYWRYQLSWGGPSDEFRIYPQPYSRKGCVVAEIEYWFLDWFDGASIKLTGADARWFRDFFESFFVDSGTAEYHRQQAEDDE